MSTLQERLVVACPYVRAREYLSDTLSEPANQHREERLPLTAQVEHLPAQFEKNVVVRYSAGRDPMHFDEPWHVSWSPEGGGPYPDFSGELTVRADEGYGSSVLELTGTYTPPLGAAGKVFDAAVGRKIASVTAQNLLASIAAQMVERYEREEAAKKQPGP